MRTKVMELHKRLLYTAIGLGALFFFIVRYSLGYWKRRGILHQKPKFFWGNVKGVCKKRHICEILQSTYETYKGQAPFIGFYAYIKPYVLVLDLQLVQQILSTDAAHFMARGLYHNIADDPLSYNLLQLDGNEWAALSKKVCPVFVSAKISALVPQLLQVAAVFRSSMEFKHRQQENFNINDLVDCYNVDVISALAFGLRGDTLRNSHTEFHSMTRTYMQGYTPLKAFLALEFPVMARLLQYKNYDQLSTDYFLKIINDKLLEREWNRHDKLQEAADFLSLFIDNKQLQDGNLRLNAKEIAAQAFTFVLNGLVPSNSTLAFCLYELALQPELQRRARAELWQTLAQHNGELTPACLENLKYLKQILQETLRLHSPYPFLLRQTCKEYELPNSVFMLAKYNSVIIPITAIHRDPDIYPEPTRFNPERFAPEAMRQRHAMSWLPFGVGPRACVAAQFAELTLLVGLATLLQRYQYAPCAETPIPLQYDNSKLLLTPKSIIKLSVTLVTDA